MFQVFFKKSIEFQLKNLISKNVFIFIFKKYWNLIFILNFYRLKPTSLKVKIKSFYLFSSSNFQ